MPRRAGEAATTSAPSLGRDAAESSRRHVLHVAASRQTGRIPIGGPVGRPSREASTDETSAKASEMRSSARRVVIEEMRPASFIGLASVRTSPGPSLGLAVSAATGEKMGRPSSAAAA